MLNGKADLDTARRGCTTMSLYVITIEPAKNKRERRNERTGGGGGTFIVHGATHEQDAELLNTAESGQSREGRRPANRHLERTMDAFV